MLSEHLSVYFRESTLWHCREVQTSTPQMWFHMDAAKLYTSSESSKLTKTL